MDQNNKMNRKLKVAIVGATGMAGQQAIVAVNGHPLIEPAVLAASERSAGKKYSEAIRGQGTYGWYCKELMPAWAGDMVVQKAEDIDISKIDLVISAVESDAAKVLEPMYAKEKPVISTASAFRYGDDALILVPGVNSSHIGVIDAQKRNRGWNGFIVPIPNCTTTGLVVTLKALEQLGMQRVFVMSCQATSGAGRSPGVMALDIIDNIIPFIKDEERKVIKETKTILGRFEAGKITDSPIHVYPLCTRAAVLDGHSEGTFVEFERDVTPEMIKAEIDNFNKRAAGELEGLPSAPMQMITVFDDPFMPQPRLVRDLDGGMTTSVGRIECWGNILRYFLVSHNTKMGAAKGAVLVAELLMKNGYI